MKTVLMLACVIVCAAGLFVAFFNGQRMNDFITGSTMLFIGGLAFVIIARRK